MSIWCLEDIWTTYIWLGKRCGCYYNYDRFVYWWYVCPDILRFTFFGIFIVLCRCLDLLSVENHVKRTFCKVPDGAKRCELIYVNDIAFLDLLDSQTALCYFSKPSDEMLDFLYNRFYSETLNQKRLLMNEHLKIYVVNGRVFNEKYGISKYDLPMSDEECLLCILPDELNPEVMSSKEVALRDYEIRGGLFSEYV